jgi:hypothetical protein
MATIGILSESNNAKLMDDRHEGIGVLRGQRRVLRLTI